MHIKKLKMQGSIAIGGHICRTHNTYKNSDVDLMKSEDNIYYKLYNHEYLKQRLDEVYIYGRNGKHKDDFVYTCDVCVHYPNDCNVDEITFFNSINKVMNNIFGSENCVCSVAHFDEINPHLHYQFIPVYDDKVHGKSLNAKKLINKEFLKQFHDVVETELLNFGVVCKLHDETKHLEYVNDIYDYKLKKANDDLADLSKQYNDDLNIIKEQYLQSLKYLNEQQKLLDNQIKNTKEKLKSLGLEDYDKITLNIPTL